MWKLKASLLQEPQIVASIAQAIVDAKQEAKQDGLDDRATWEYVKYKARQKARAEEKKYFKEAKANRVKWQKTVDNHFANPQKRDEVRAAKENLVRLDEEETQRLIDASKVKWAEHNEKSSTFFYNRLKQASADSNIMSLQVNGVELDATEVNQEVHRYYSDLFRGRHTADIDGVWKERITEMARDIPHIPESMGQPLTTKEIEKVVFKMMAKGKAPGNDGLPVEFYRTFWKEVKEPLFQALKESLLIGEMSASQRQSVIRLLRKKDKDPAELKNWRPISLMNVDTKILIRRFDREAQRNP
jgi:hypothetical protein